MIECGASLIEQEASDDTKRLDWMTEGTGLTRGMIDKMMKEEKDEHSGD